VAPATRQTRATKAAEPRGLAFKLPGDLIDDLDAIARAEGRSRTKQIEVALRQFVQSYRHRTSAA
jgi:metal-responsive CopG/Arc/MetJ family transcriptional regulator